MKNAKAFALGLIVPVLLVALGAAASWYFTRPKPVVETSAPAAVQSDGSHILERKPDAAAKPKQQIPKGAKVERIGSVTVKPTATPDNPVQLDWTVVRFDDNTRRVVASSPDGEVVGGVDIPVESAAPPPEPKLWAAGMSYSPTQQTAGVWIERDVWRVRLGLDVNQVRPVITGPTDVEARLRVGITF